MKRVISGAMLVAMLLSFGAMRVEAVVVRVEPDDFAEDGTIVVPGVRLSTITSGRTFPVVSKPALIAGINVPASTGTLVFGYLFSTFVGWREATLRIDFDFPTDYVSLDFIRNDRADYATLRAYNADGGLIAEKTIGNGAIGSFETVEIGDPSASIAYVTASGDRGNDILIDNFAFNHLCGVPEEPKEALIFVPFNAPDGTTLMEAPVEGIGAGFWTDNLDNSFVRIGALEIRRRGGVSPWTSFLYLGVDDGVVWLKVVIRAIRFRGQMRAEKVIAGLTQTPGDRPRNTAVMVLGRNKDNRITLEGWANGVGGTSLAPVAIHDDRTLDEELTLVLKLDLEKDQYQIFYQIGDDAPFTSIGTGNVSDARAANFLRLAAMYDFSARGEMVLIDSMEVTRHDPIGDVGTVISAAPSARSSSSVNIQPTLFGKIKEEVGR